MRFLFPQGILLGLLMLQNTAAVLAQTTVTALLSQDAAPYHQVLQGVQQFLAQHHLDVTLDVRIMDQAEMISEESDSKHSDDISHVILALGSKAAQYAVEHFKQTPLCAGLIIDSQPLNQASNATAVILGFPLEIEWHWLKQFSLQGQAVAVLYHPEKNQSELERLTKLAQMDGVELIVMPVPEPSALPRALERLPRKVGLIWSFPGSGVLNAQSAKEVLLYSFRNRIPLVGLSNRWTKAGALYSLDRDYVDIGRQCGEKIMRILQGTAAEKIPIDSPRKVLYSINKKTVEHMKLDLPDELIEGADEIY